MIYKPLDFPKLNEFIELWNRLAKKEGLNGIYFIGHTQDYIDEKIMKQYFQLDLNVINTAGVWYARREYSKKFINKVRLKLSTWLLKQPSVIPYKKLYPLFISKVDKLINIFPTIIPNWDHSPRSGKKGYIMTGSNPNLFEKHIKEILNLFEGQKDPIIFLKSWNEWGEGNYMEPDLKYSKGYIETLKNVLKE